MSRWLTDALALLIVLGQELEFAQDIDSMKRLWFSCLLLIGVVAVSPIFPAPTPLALAQDGLKSTPFNGPCSLLTTENPRSAECDAEIAANPLPPLEPAVLYDEQRDKEAHPRSVYIPSDPLPYPIAWQKRPWYFSDAPGILPAADDWTNARLIGKYAMYYVYSQYQAADRSIWYLIGSGRWMKDEFVSVFQIPEKPEEAVGPWAAIDLSQQTLVAFMDDKPVYATLISAGYWLATLEGQFQIYGRTFSMEMKGPPGADPPAYRFVTKWVQFFNEHEAIHSADFHNYFGINRTHGCVNLAPGDAEWMWNFFDQTADQWHPSGRSSFFVDYPELAPWIVVYNSSKTLTIPTWE